MELSGNLICEHYMNEEKENKDYNLVYDETYIHVNESSQPKNLSCYVRL